MMTSETFSRVVALESRLVTLIDIQRTKGDDAAIIAEREEQLAQCRTILATEAPFQLADPPGPGTQAPRGPLYRDDRLREIPDLTQPPAGKSLIERMVDEDIAGGLLSCQ